MNDRLRLSVSALALASMTLGGAMTVSADELEITITNVTRGQVFSPPIIATHGAKVRLFEGGEPASDELAAVAETGDTAPLADLLSNTPRVGAVVRTEDAIPPGGSVTVVVDARRGGRISIIGMLVNTNDAFFAIDSQTLPRTRNQTRRYTANAYDAGSEANNEDCAFIPGPACPEGSGNLREEAGAEGFVHIHAGIHEVGDLLAADTDWRNPVAQVTVRRLH